MKRWRALGVGMSVLLVGCAGWFGPNYRHNPEDGQPIVMRVSGYGTYADGVDRRDARQRLMAMRASQLDAYRALTERVYGTVISGNSGVNQFVLQQDSVRAYIDSYLRGAKVIAVNHHPDGVVETVLELHVLPRFQTCINYYYQASAGGAVPGQCLLPQTLVTGGAPTPARPAPLVVSPPVAAEASQGSSLYFLE